MKHLRQADLSLGIVAFLAFVLWRAEVEWRNWDGLQWIGYFHVAVPVAVALFLVWIWVWLDAPSPRKKVGVVVVLSLFGLIATPLTEVCLKTSLNRFAFHAFGSPWWYLLFWWLLTPSIVVGILRAFRISVRWRRWALGQILFVFAWPLATALIYLFPQHGYSDATHAFKSGFVAPFFLFALGITIPTRK